MYQVGTQAGNVHPPLSQGVGFATVLTGGNADDYAVKYGMLRKQARDKALADRAAARNSALAKMTSAVPDFFYAHQKEIGSAVDDMMAKGQAAMRAGAIDPYSSTDPASIEFQKAAAQVAEMGKFSAQIKDQYKAFQQDIQAKGPDYFDPNTLTQSQSYFFDRTLGDHMANPTTAPLVQQRKPLQNSIELASGWAGKLSTGAPKDGAVDPKTARETIRAAFRDPESGPNVLLTFSTALKGYSDDERAALENEALQNGLSAPEMYALKTTQAFLKSPAPYSVNDALANGDKLFEPSTKEWHGAESFSKGVDQGASLKSANSVARGILHDDPRALSSFAALYKLKQDPAQTEAEFFDDVQHAMAQDLYARAKKVRESGVTSEGQGKKDLELSTDRWLQDMKSGKRELAQEAAGVLSGVKLYGNLFVEKAQTIGFNEAEWPEGLDFDMKPGEMDKAKILRLKLKTPMGVQLDKDEVQGLMGAEGPGKVEVMQKQGETEVYINLDKLEPTDQLLRTLYQSGHKQTGVLYKGPGWTSQTQLQEILKPQGKPAPKTAPAKPVFQF